MASAPNPEIDAKIATVTAMTQWIADVGTRFTDAANAVRDNIPDIALKAPMGKAIDVAAMLAKTVDNFEDSIKAFKAEIAKMKEVHLPERFDNEEVSTFNTETFRVTRTMRTFASISGDQEEAFDWLRSNDYAGLIKETVNSSSLSAAAKELMENGRELPDDIFSVYNKNGVSITIKKAARG